MLLFRNRTEISMRSTASIKKLQNLLRYIAKSIRTNVTDENTEKPGLAAGGVSKGGKVPCGMPVAEACGVSKGGKVLLGMPVTEAGGV